MESTTGDKGEKALLIVCNLALGVVWLHLLIHLITRWNVMTTNPRDVIGLFMMFFSFLWLTLIREKRSFISVLMAGWCLYDRI